MAAVGASTGMAAPPRTNLTPSSAQRETRRFTMNFSLKFDPSYHQLGFTRLSVQSRVTTAIPRAAPSPAWTGPSAAPSSKRPRRRSPRECEIETYTNYVY